MALFAGFELPDSQTIADLEQWPAFAEWWEREQGFAPTVGDSSVREIFAAYVQGAYWEWHRAAFGEG